MAYVLSRLRCIHVGVHVCACTAMRAMCRALLLYAVWSMPCAVLCALCGVLSLSCASHSLTGERRDGVRYSGSPQGASTTSSAPTGDGSVGVRDYEALAVLGRGAHSKIIQVRHRASGGIFAMKVLRKRDLVATRQVENVMRECRVLLATEHPFVTRLHHAFQSPERVFLVMSYAAGGDMFTLLTRKGRFSNDVTKFYAAEMILALRCVHRLSVIGHPTL